MYPSDLPLFLRVYITPSRASGLTEAVFCDSCTESLQYATGSWGRIVNSTAKLTLSL